MTSKIEIQGVERTFSARKKEVHALGPVDLEVADGEFLCIVGPSGCGKSTLLRLIAGLVPPSEGRVAIHQRDPKRSLVSMVFQDYSIYPWKTVEANVRLGLDIDKMPRKEAQRRVDHQLERLGLTDFRASYPHQLSGGMRQRVSIARALVVEPEVLLMDEPFAALDAQLRMVLQEELLALWQEDRRTVVFVTHSLDEAILLGDRILVMSSRPGKIVSEFTVPFERPRTMELRATAEFGELEQEIWHVLRTEVNKTLPPSIQSGAHFEATEAKEGVA